MSNTIKNLESSPKTIYVVLSILTGIIGLFLLFSWANEITNGFGLFFGVVFWIVSVVTFIGLKKDN